MEARIGKRLTMEESPSGCTKYPSRAAMVWAVVTLHSCKPTISAPAVRMTSMQLLRLNPPCTQTLNDMTLSCVTGAALTEDRHEPTATRKASRQVFHQDAA